MDSKICSKCHVEKSINEFSKRKNRKSGLISHCKECDSNQSKKYSINNPEKVKERGKQYRINNRVKERERSKRYGKNNREKK